MKVIGLFLLRRKCCIFGELFSVVDPGFARRRVADLGGRKGRAFPSRPKFLHFHGVIGKYWSNSMLAPSTGVEAPSGKSWTRYWTDEHQTQRWGRQPNILADVPQKLYENKENWIRRQFICQRPGFFCEIEGSK